LGGGGQMAGAVSFATSGTLYPGVGLTGNPVTLSLAGTLSLSDSANVTVNLATSGTTDEVKVGGALTLSANANALDTLTVNLLSAPTIGITYDFLSASNGNGGGNFATVANVAGTYAGQYIGTVGYDSVGNAYDVTFAPAVPEPETWGMLAAGLGMMGLVFRSRRLRSGR